MPSDMEIAAKPSRKKVPISTIETKKKIIANYENGMRVVDLAIMFNMPKTTVWSILKRKEAIKAAKVATGVTTLAHKRSPTLEEMEELLLMWINEKQLAGDSLFEGAICEKAKELYGELREREPGTSVEKHEFKASRGWFERFRKRTGIHSAVKHAETISDNLRDIENFLLAFRQYIASEELLPQQVFNCDETVLLWRKVPRGTFDVDNNVNRSTDNPMKDRVTLLLCSNASGDCKIKPLLVYHTDYPQELRNKPAIRDDLNVMWRSNARSWVTRQLFTEWFREEFCPVVRSYLLANSLPLKALLILDNAPGHPPDIENNFVGDCNFVKVMFLPSNITSIIQPMNQQIISTFKQLYVKAVFQRCFDLTHATDLTISDFWRYHFNIIHCVNYIDEAWKDLPPSVLNSAWHKIWPDCAVVTTTEFDESPLSLHDEIVGMANCLGFGVNIYDLEEFVDEHNAELNMDELQHLQRQQRNDFGAEVLLAKNEPAMNMTRSELNELFAAWNRAKGIIEKWHPDPTLASRSINLFHDNIMSYFHNIENSRENLTAFQMLLSAAKNSESNH